MTTPNHSPVRIDIVSDVVCPWCIIGYRELQSALSESELTAEIHWHPFELNPQMPEEGENLRSHLAAKYGTTLEGSRAARARLTHIGETLGFEFNYADDMGIYPTFRAHQLLYWAKETKGWEVQHRLKQALFASYFSHRKNVNDPSVLAERAEHVGLDPKEAIQVLNEQRFAQEVRREERTWVERGVRGVPAIIFDESYLIGGAQGVETYREMLAELAKERAA